MRLCYVLLSPTWGMHQYTADLANRMAAAGHEVHVLTTSLAPLDRYAPEIVLHTPVATADTGFSLKAARRAPAAARDLASAISRLSPDVVHVTGPHLWNPFLLGALRRAGVPTVHTIHDLHPHAGARYGRLLYGWNAWVRRRADHLLVHGQRYRDELLAQGVEADRITCTRLTHLFLGYEAEQTLFQTPPEVRYEPWALMIGRLEAYKGVDVLVDAARNLNRPEVCVVVAGPGQIGELVRGSIPTGVEVRDHLVGDDEAMDLFCRCGLVVLPYVEASQSALVAAAYFFRKPVLVTRAGALPEYVRDGETGWVIPPGEPRALAGTLREALADRDRLARMGQRGFAHYGKWRQEEERVLQALYAGLPIC